MYTKILIVSLVQAALARNIRDGRLFRTDYYSGIQIRNPGSENFEMYNIDQLRRPDCDEYTSYSDADYRSVQNEDRRDIEDFISHDKTSNDKTPVKHFEYYDQTEHEKQGILKTNLDSQSNINSDSYFNRRIDHNKQGTDSFYDQRNEDTVRTNEEFNFNSDNSRDFNQHVEANPNIHSSFVDTQASNVNLPEVPSNDDSLIYDEYNSTPNAPVKTTIDNEVRYNTNKDNKEEKWVWSDISAKEPNTNLPNKTEPVLPSGDLDDRTIFNGDACPKGQAKVIGRCIDKHQKSRHSVRN